MKKKITKKSWLEKKLSGRAFREGYMIESRQLAIAEQIVRLRKERGLTQAALASRIGTTASAISRYESADYTSYEIQTLHKIAKACGSSLKINFSKPSHEEKAA